MMSKGTPDRMFAEFTPVPTDEWEDQIRRDLRGADYAETLLWKTEDGLTLRPYYRRDDLDQIEHLQEDYTEVQIRNDWRLRQDFYADHLDTDKSVLQQALNGGASDIGVIFDASSSDQGHDPEIDELPAILSDVPIDSVGIHLHARLASRRLLRPLLNEAERRSLDVGALRGTLGYDPLASLVGSGRLARQEIQAAAELITNAGSSAPGLRLLRIGTDVYHNGGATVVQETALALASVSEYLVLLIEQGCGAQEVLDRMYVEVAVSTSFFREIAKLRALRLLIPQVIERFLPAERAFNLPIHVRTSRRKMTLYDAHTNLLRATTEAASAVIGGCDVLVIRPFDTLHGPPSAFGLRLARNIQHLLRHESHLAEVNDPAGGSYYLEVITDAIARRSWTEFKKIEEMGGLIAALDSGHAQAEIGASRGRIESDVARGRRVLVGTNLYPNPLERLDDEAPKVGAIADAGSETRGVSNVDGGRDKTEDEFEVDPIPPFRESEVIEAARRRTESMGTLPRVLILPIGRTSDRIERSRFAATVFTGGGIPVEIPAGYETLEAALAAEHETPDIVVLAASDELYTQEVIGEITDRYPLALIVVTGSSHESLDVDFVVSQGMDVPKMIRSLQDGLLDSSGGKSTRAVTSGKPARGV